MTELHLLGCFGDEVDPLRPTGEELRLVLEQTADWNVYVEAEPGQEDHGKVEVETPW
jgi:hypothetical protein